MRFSKAPIDSPVHLGAETGHRELPSKASIAALHGVESITTTPASSRRPSSVGSFAPPSRSLHQASGATTNSSPSLVAGGMPSAYERRTGIRVYPNAPNRHTQLVLGPHDEYNARRLETFSHSRQQFYNDIWEGAAGSVDSSHVAAHASSKSRIYGGHQRPERAPARMVKQSLNHPPTRAETPADACQLCESRGGREAAGYGTSDGPRIRNRSAPNYADMGNRAGYRSRASTSPAGTSLLPHGVVKPKGPL